MKNLKIDIHFREDQTIIVSYRHPLTQMRNRQNFSNLQEAKEFKKELERKFNCKDIPLSRYEELTIKELLFYFLKEVPDNLFSSRKEHLVDFFETFGDSRLCEVTRKELKEWLDQVQKENGLKESSMKGLQWENQHFL